MGGQKIPDWLTQALSLSKIVQLDQAALRGLFVLMREVNAVSRTPKTLESEYVWLTIDED